MSGPFKCARCGDEFASDPRLVVDCPTCGAKAGLGCIRPSEHRGNMVQPHKRRRTLAFKQMPCSCLKNWLKSHPEEATRATA